MARSFDDAVSDKIENATTAVISNEPMTLACWFQPSSLDSTDTLLSVGNPAEFGFWRIATNSSDVAAAHKQSDAGASGLALTTAILSINTWHHVAGVFPGDADRTVYLDGANAVQDTTSIADSVAARTSIGIQAGNLGAPTPADGLIAEVAIWSAALTVAEITSLAKGFSPKRIRPTSLVFYAPLIRELTEVKGLTLTATGTTVAAHPRIFGA